ncbi:MAG: uroporphyrinogen decarboxylase, partial [Pseudomonadota bacterium]
MPSKKLMRVLGGESLDVPPIWLMRQAGRYLPEYRATRAEAGSFLDLCYRPDLAEEVTLQPIRRYGFDAAILFADILLVPQAIGADVWFVEGEGPRLSQIKSSEDVSNLKPVDAVDETLSPIYETVSRLSKSLPDDVTLIGFAGAPWTVATYMVAGRGTPDQGPARRMMYQDPGLFGGLIDRITEATSHYLSQQILAGAEVVKIFDSWAGVLAPEAFQAYAVEPVARIVADLKARHPDVPIIGFPRGAGIQYADFADRTGVDAMAV